MLQTKPKCQVILHTPNLTQKMSPQRQKLCRSSICNFFLQNHPILFCTTLLGDKMYPAPASIAGRRIREGGPEPGGAGVRAKTGTAVRERYRVALTRTDEPSNQMPYAPIERRTGQHSASIPGAVRLPPHQTAPKRGRNSPRSRSRARPLTVPGWNPRCPPSVEPRKPRMCHRGRCPPEIPLG
jgi:hypothetical protein